MAKKTAKVPVKTEEARGGAREYPLESLAGLRDEVDRLFEEFSSMWPIRPFRRGGGWLEPFRRMPFGWGPGIPAVDVVDKDTEIQLRAELPGMDEKDIDVRLSDDMITIRGEKREEREEGEEEGNYYVSERRYGAFERTFPLPTGIDSGKVSAGFSKGVLTVTLPKTAAARAKTKKIEVKAEK